MPQIVALDRHLTVELCLDRRPWTYAVEHMPAIRRHWRLSKALNPAYFNGAVHMLTSGRHGAGTFRGELLASDFQSFIHWRALGHPDRSVRATGVGAVLWSLDDAVLLGTAASGTANAGRTYLFSGVLDERDIDGRGGADVVGGAMREVREETGLDAGETEPASPWVWSIEDGVWISFVAECRARLPAEALRHRILAHNAALAEPELADVAVIRSAADLERADIFDNTRVILQRLMSQCEV